MIGLILTASFLCHLSCSSVLDEVKGRTVSGEKCMCSLTLPNYSFPAERLESLEIKMQNLSATAQEEVNKRDTHESILIEYQKKIHAMAERLELVESGGASLLDLDFNALKLDISMMEKLVTELRNDVSGSSSIIDQLQSEMMNISNTVKEMESYDKLNVLKVQRAVTLLKEQLKQCKKKQEMSWITSPEYWSCKHGGLQSISQPFVVKLNWMGQNHKHGGWGKDPFPSSMKQDVYWVAPLITDGRRMDLYREYSSYDNLLLYKYPVTYQLAKNENNVWNYSYSGQGSGMVVYKGFMYYHCFNSRDMCRININTHKVERQVLNQAAYNDRFSYSGARFQDMDFTVDEHGVWVLYVNEAGTGNIIIGKINEELFTVEETWVTTVYKPSASNAFMICGVLYVTKSVSQQKDNVFYTFDTKTNKEGSVNIILDKVEDTVQNLNYNPSDHKLYMYSNGFMVTYDINFEPLDNVL
ncbi:olfactomedin-like [Protopterus annectens]|uniref:olfactomedin-like n=1 Tax=Protopterus annectens TaxID=7888 RepID=UPI001CFC2660|nr:olfactomedin-like [Protopterus annectens]